MKFSVFAIVVVELLVTLAAAGAGLASPAPRPDRGVVGSPSNLPELPLRFEPNVGQFDSSVEFVARTRDGTVFLTSTEAIVVARAPACDTPSTFRMRFATDAEHARPSGCEPLSGLTNYFLGNDPERWRTDVPGYSSVRYPSVFPGVDAVFYGSARGLEYDFVVSRAEDVSAIRLTFAGAESLAVDADGSLVVGTAHGQMHHLEPAISQTIDGVTRPVGGGFRVCGPNEAGFTVSGCDPAEPLVIDPVIGLSTFVGGGGRDLLGDIAIAPDGGLLVAGYGDSTNLPTEAPLQSASGGMQDIYVAKLNHDGTALVFATYLGGSADDECQGVGVDDAGNVFVGGSSESSNFPTANAFQQALGGGTDLVAVKLNPQGNALVYSTYFGGAALDLADDVKVDGSGSAYFVGKLTIFAFDGDAVVIKLDPAGAFDWGVALNASSSDTGSAINVDASGNVYIGGYFRASGAGYHNLLVKIGPAGNSLVYALAFGGSADDFAHAIAVDASGNAIVAGSTKSFDYPTSKRADTGAGSIAPMAASGTTRLVVGDATRSAAALTRFALAVEPTFPPQLASPRAGTDFDVFVTKVNAAGTAMVFSRTLAGSGSDGSNGVALASDGTVYVTGFSSSTDFPVQNPIQAANAGDSDCVLVRLDPDTGGLADAVSWCRRRGDDWRVSHLLGAARSRRPEPGSS